jgi:hypothetical protein
MKLILLISAIIAVLAETLEEAKAKLHDDYNNLKTSETPKAKTGEKRKLSD